MLKALPIAGQQRDRRRVVRDVFEDAYNYMKSGQLIRQVVNKINDVDFNDLSERQHFGDIYEQILNDLQSAGNAGEYYTPRALTAFMADRIDPGPAKFSSIQRVERAGSSHLFTSYARTLRQAAEDEQKMQPALRAVEKKQSAHALRHQHVAPRYREPRLCSPR